MLSDRMNEIKQKTGLTNASWAERSGVPISTVSRILSGATENPGFQTVLNNNFYSSFCFFLFLPLNTSHFLSLHCSNSNFLRP